MGHGAKKRSQRLDAKRRDEPTQEQRTINQALEKGNQKQHHHQQPKQKSLEQVKRDGERISQKQGKTATLIHREHISSDEITALLAELKLEAKNTVIHDTPNPNTGQFSTLIEFDSFDSAAQAIHQTPTLLDKVTYTKWSNVKTIQSKNKFTPKPPPTPEHRAIMVQYNEEKDENQIRNLAMLVSRPSAVRVPTRSNRDTGKFFAFVEMETQEEAKELLTLIPKEPGYRAFWAREPNLQSDNRSSSIISNWAQQRKLTLVTSTELSQETLNEIIGSLGENVKSSKLATKSVNDQFFNVVEFDQAKNARQFYSNQMKSPTKGCQVVVETMLEHQDYLPRDEVDRLLESRDLIQGELRVPKSKFDRGYVSNPQNRHDDYIIVGRGAMNRALTGDTVAIRVLPEAAWERMENGEVRKTAEVVHIMSKRLVQSCSGSFSVRQLYPPGHPGHLLFEPMDSRIPRVLISIDSLKDGQLDLIVNSLQAKTLFEVEIKEWEEGSHYISGELIQTIGDPGDLNNLMTGLLINYGIDSKSIDELADNELPDADWTIPADEIKKRRDFRSECVFTIDPLTARDLDDALHVKKLDNGNYEVGVHIADVSYFVKPQSEIDQIASNRCTSTYMPDRVISMLPRRLCEHLCSLNPGVDRLSYSVVFEMSPDGKRVGTPWYGRGIIRSCAKLAYEHAQVFIDEHNKGELCEDFSHFPTIGGGYELDRIRHCVLALAQLAIGLRKARVENGSVRIEQVKIGFVWDPDTKVPVGFHPYIRKEAHKLIEEFMLAANIAVAEKINQELPELAFLRQHAPPDEEEAENLEGWMKTLNLKASFKNSKAVAQSLKNLFEKTQSVEGGIDKDTFNAAMSLRVVKIMQMAEYLCAGAIESNDYSHYALAVPLYTHFTSPIRRMADLVVHRQLSAALNDTSDVDACEYEVGNLTKQAKMCNVRKMNAKLCGEEGSSVYLWAFIKAKSNSQEFIMQGVITDLVEHGFEVLILQTGSSIRCYYGEMEILKWEQKIQNGVKRINIDWAKDNKPLGRNKMRQPLTSRKGEKASSESLSYFSLVNVSVQAADQPGKLMGTIKPPQAVQDQIREGKLVHDKMKVALKPSAGVNGDDKAKLTTRQEIEVYENIIKSFGKVE